MKGQSGIIETRLAGKAPKIVNVYTDGDIRYESTEPLDPFPDLIIYPHDNLSSLDLRFLVGLTVSVSGMDSRRVDAVSMECQAAKAKRVISNYCKCDFVGSELVVAVTRVEDTEGVLTWEQAQW